MLDRECVGPGEQPGKTLMPKYRKKPIVIDAVQWWPPGHSQHTPIEGVERGPRDDQPWGVATLEGFMVANPGDWIITGVKGEKYPCRDDIFRATYELADPNPTESGGFVDLEGDAMP